MELKEFKIEFKKHHICGADILGYALTYSSDCPRCEPNSYISKEEHEKELRKAKNKLMVVKLENNTMRTRLANSIPKDRVRELFQELQEAVWGTHNWDYFKKKYLGES